MDRDGFGLGGRRKEGGEREWKNRMRENVHWVVTDRY